jgi:CRISPR-associated exonuclease Cas4
LNKTEREHVMDEPINISALNQFAYCPRRFALIYLEAEFQNNVHTQRGNAEHERVDRVAHTTSRSGARVEYALPVWSERLGLIGKCDVVEFWQDGTVYPVEYKHGPRRAWVNDDLQLAAQAMCLEEMLGVQIQKSAIFHAASKRRREVEIDGLLRGKASQALVDIRACLVSQQIPAPTTEIQRCRECSLKDICQPVAVRGDVQAARAALFDPDA